MGNARNRTRTYQPKINNNNRKRSRLNTHFASKTGKERQEALRGKIWEGEVRNVIDQRNRWKAVGTDNITAEILRSNKNWLAPLPTDILNDGKYKNNMNNDWLQGIVTFIYKIKTHYISKTTDQLRF